MVRLLIATGHLFPVEIARIGASPALNNFSPSASLRMSSTLSEPRTTMAPARRGRSVCDQTKSLAVRASTTTKIASAILQKTRHLVRTLKTYLSPPGPKAAPSRPGMLAETALGVNGSS